SYSPVLRDVDTAALAKAAAEQLGEERVEVSGPGGVARVDAAATERAFSALVQCALRHGGLEQVEGTAHRRVLTTSPLTSASAPVLLGQELRGLGAAVAVRLVEALGGSVAVTDETLSVELPE